MPTAYSSEVAVGSTNRIRLRVEYSGTNASCHIEFRRTSGYSTTWSDPSASIVLNGISRAAPYSYTGYVGTDWITLVSAYGYTIPAYGGTFDWTFSNPSGGVLGGSGIITIQPQATPPSGLTVSAPYNITPDGATFDVSISSYGIPSDAAGRFLEAGVFTTSTYGAPNRSAIALETLSATIVVNNNSSYGTGLTVEPNTQYYYGAVAYNTDQATTLVPGQFVTTPSLILVGTPTTSGGVVTIPYHVPADGGYYDKTIEWSDDDGTTWNTITTITGGGATQGTFTITGLTTGEHTVLVRSRTPSGSAGNVSITFDVAGVRLIVSNEAIGKESNRVLASVDGTATEISRILVSHNGIATEVA